MDLKSKLEQNDQQILNLEINLTKLLNEQEAGVANGDLPEPVKLFELRDELALR